MENEKVKILDLELDRKNFPILFERAKNNPEGLKDELVSVANAWHEGSLVSAAQALESDLQHSL